MNQGTKMHATGIRTFRRLATLLAFWALAGCESFGPEEPTGPGSFFVDLQSPYGAEGGAVFEIEGGFGLGEVTSIGAYTFYERNDDITRVVVILPMPGPIQFQVVSQNVRDLPIVTLIEVAGPDNALRTSVDGYEVEVFQMADRRAR